jgi:outer membrane receptor protein involved in Fe transport
MDINTGNYRWLLAASLTISALTTGALCTTANAQDGIEAIEEIIVVATRREESVQDIPVAVTAMTGTMLEDSGAIDVYILQEQAPGLVVSRSQQSTTASFAIRGVGTSSQNNGLESSVGLYVDGVYRSRQSSIINNLVDMRTVEVLRGPQGTLFGKNTPSGAILFNTVAPTGSNRMAANEADAFAEVTVGDFGLVNLNAASNIPLIEDTLALRATIFSSKRDGYVSEVTAGSDVINDIDRQGGRLQLMWTPNENLSMRVIGDYSEIDETCCAALTRTNNFVAADLGPPNFGSDSVLTLLGGNVITADQFENRIMALNQLPKSSNKDSGLSVEFDYDLANSTLTSITAYREFETFDDIDADFSDTPLFSKSNDVQQSSFSQEFRLAGEFGERTRYVTGLYYFTQEIDSDATTTTGPAFSPFLQAGSTQVQQLIQFVDGIAAATAGVPVPPGPLPPAGALAPVGTFARDTMAQDHRSWAAFAQMDLDITESLTLTAGLRYTDEHKELNGVFTNNPLGPPVDLVAVLTQAAIFQADPGAYNPYSPASLAALTPVRADSWGVYLPGLDVLAPRPNVQETLDDDHITGTLKLSWFANENVMLYGGFATGYKSGGTNTDRIPDGFNYVFGPETSQSFELGMKSTLLDRKIQLNIAVHITDVDDLQANSFTGAGFNLQNAGKAKTHGAEVEMLWRPTDIFDLQIAYTYSVAEFEDFQDGTCWVATPFHTGVDDPGSSNNPLVNVCDRSGDRLPGNPEHNLFVAAQLDFNLTGNTSMFIRPELNYYSDTMTDGDNDPMKLRDSYSIWNLRVGLNIDSIESTLTFWGRNLTDEASYETVFTVPLQDGKLNAYPREPRTIGVTFRKDF